MGNFNLTEAAKEILDANVASKNRGQEHGVGDTKLDGSVAYGTKEVGSIRANITMGTKDSAPDATKGVPTATPPGATPPVGSEKDGVGAEIPHGQPQETMGRSDLLNIKKTDAVVHSDDHTNRKASPLAPQMMQKNPGAHFDSYHEDIDAMLSGENLSEEFKEKASIIFEAAVNARANEIIEAAQTDMQEQFEIAVEEIKEELASKVDEYLDYMVEEWIKENELAITSGLRAEVVEDFMSGLRNLFIEHHIDIPEDKVNIVEELVSKVEELESELNEQIYSAVEMKKELNEHKKFEAIYAACEGLTQTQVEKIKSLAESIEYTDAEDFLKKLETIKESYIGGKTFIPADSSALDDEVQIVEEKKTGSFSDPEMAVYSKAISQSVIK